MKINFAKIKDLSKNKTIDMIIYWKFILRID
jgi:hypothetical protein